MPNVYGKYDAGGGTGAFFKIKDGETKKIRIFSEEPLARNAPPYKEGGKPQTKYAWVVWNFTDKQAQIMDMPVTVYRAIEQLALSEWGDPTSYNINVSRQGEMKDTRYFFNPAPKSQSLSVDEEEACREIDLKKRFPEGIWTSEAVAGKKLPEAKPDWVPDNEEGYEPSEEELKAMGL